MAAKNMTARRTFQTAGKRNLAVVRLVEIEELWLSSGAKIAAFLGPAEYFDLTGFEFLDTTGSD